MCVCVCVCVCEYARMNMYYQFYLWQAYFRFLVDHEPLKRKSAAIFNPFSTEPYAIREASYTLKATMNTGCDISAKTAVADGIGQNLGSSVPCLLQGLCSQRVSTSCASPTRKRSTPALQVILEFSLNPNFGPNQKLQGTDCMNTQFPFSALLSLSCLLSSFSTYFCCSDCLVVVFMFC